MNSLNKVYEDESSIEDNLFVVTLWLEKCGTAFVRSCEIVGTNFRNRISFGTNATLHFAFSRKMVDGIASCLERLSQKTEVLTLPEFVLELPDLILRGVRILATKLPTGVTNIIIRFVKFIGVINSAINNDIGLNCRILDKNSEISAKVLSDIATPILDICLAIEKDYSGVSNKFGKFGKKIFDQSHELRFQIELLKRFVRQQSCAGDSLLTRTTLLKD